MEVSNGGSSGPVRGGGGFARCDITYAIFNFVFQEFRPIYFEITEFLIFIVCFTFIFYVYLDVWGAKHTLRAFGGP